MSIDLTLCTKCGFWWQLCTFHALPIWIGSFAIAALILTPLMWWQLAKS